MGFLLFYVCGFFIFSDAIPVKYVSRTGHLHVKSTNRVMNIEADNFQVYCEINTSTGEVNFTGLMKSFEFKLGALDQAYNGSKVDMNRYPKFEYKGQLKNFKSIPFDKPGSYEANVNGILKIGDFTRDTSAKGRITVSPNGTISATANFTIVIEEQSMQLINKLMREKLPSAVSIDTKKLGVSRNIQLNLKAEYRGR